MDRTYFNIDSVFKFRLWFDYPWELLSAFSASSPTPAPANPPAAMAGTYSIPSRPNFLVLRELRSDVADAYRNRKRGLILKSQLTFLWVMGGSTHNFMNFRLQTPNYRIFGPIRMSPACLFVDVFHQNKQDSFWLVQKYYNSAIVIWNSWNHGMNSI